MASVQTIQWFSTQHFCIFFKNSNSMYLKFWSCCLTNSPNKLCTNTIEKNKVTLKVNLSFLENQILKEKY